MPKLEIELTEAQIFALSVTALDPIEFMDNFATDRARVEKERLKGTPEWTQAAVALAGAGGNTSDDWAVLLQGRDDGLFQTAAQISEANILAIATGIEAPPSLHATFENVQQALVGRKMALLNVSSVADMQDAILNGTREAVKLMRIQVTPGWTAEQAQRAAQLEAVEGMIDALEDVAKALIGEIQGGAEITQEAMQSDPRWDAALTAPAA